MLCVLRVCLCDTETARSAHSVSRLFRVLSTVLITCIILIKIKLLKSRLSKSSGRLHAVRCLNQEQHPLILHTSGHTLANLLEMEWSLGGQVKDNVCLILLNYLDSLVCYLACKKK